ncbi:MAG: calcium/sodium antiporter [Pseudomonadota bacterium]
MVYLLFAIGLALLVFGGEWLIKGSVAVAERLGIAPLIIGLTIVAFGTSAPELVISLRAALSGNGGIAVGNVVGSNIANVLLVLGVPLLFSSIYCADKGMKTTLTFLIGVTVLFMVQMWNGPITRFDGIILLLCLAAFLYMQFLSARKQKAADLAADIHDEIGEPPQNGWLAAGYVIAGLLALPAGAALCVDAAVEIASRWGVPDEVVGLTIVAIGTSLPELATSITAARHGNTSVAVGNVIGSNLFNIAAIMGVTAAATNVPIGEHILQFDMWVMLAATLFLIALPVFKVSLGRKAGLVLCAVYLIYLGITATF